MPDAPAWKRAPFNHAEKMAAALAAHPKLAAICAAVKAHPGIQKHLATRGKQGF
jgi:hypothetical protein